MRSQKVVQPGCRGSFLKRQCQSSLHSLNELHNGCCFGLQQAFHDQLALCIYLRRMLIHGARAVLLRVKYDTGGFGQVGASAGSACSAQQSRGRDREQTGSHGLGCVVQRPRVSTSAAAAGGGLMAVEKTLRLESTERFPLPTATTTKMEKVPPSAEERRRRKNSPTACRKTWTLKRVPGDRGI